MKIIVDGLENRVVLDSVMTVPAPAQDSARLPRKAAAFCRGFGFLGNVSGDMRSRRRAVKVPENG